MKEYPLSYLPNQERFEFIAIYKNGQEKLAVVKKSKDGTHYIEDFKQIKSWKRYWGQL